MRSILAFVILIFLFSCAKTNEPNNFQVNKPAVIKDTVSMEVFSTDTIDSISGKDLEALLQIPVRNKFKESYSGYYSYKISSDGDKQLHGEFYFAQYDSSSFLDDTVEYAEDIYFISRINYSGEFRDNRKSGTFTESLLYDDGIDIYSNWKIAIDFDQNSCVSGKFSGVMSYYTPDTTYHFQNLDSCTFDYIVRLAWKKWEEKFNSERRTRTPNEYYKILHGQWYSEGNEGAVPHWIEFDSTEHAYYTWLTDEPKPNEPMGIYEIVGDELLEIRDESYRDIRQYAFDAIETNYIDLAPLGPSAGNLIYRRKKYIPPKD